MTALRFLVAVVLTWAAPWRAVRRVAELDRCLTLLVLVLGDLAAKGETPLSCDATVRRLADALIVQHRMLRKYERRFWRLRGQEPPPPGGGSVTYHAPGSQRPPLPAPVARRGCFIFQCIGF